MPLLLLLCAFFLGACRCTAQAQARAALQSRLDVCAVELAVAREQLFSRLARGNRALEITVEGIYAARAAAVAAPGAAVVAERALLFANHSIALAQDALVAKGTATEFLAMRCRGSNFSRELAWCAASPPLRSALVREETLFPDVSGPLSHPLTARRDLAAIRCASAHGLATNLEIRGDPRLREEGFNDAYRK
ncbi:MAG: hypothetical protein ACXWSF_17285 [Bdellovibrionota bacterium]